MSGIERSDDSGDRIERLLRYAGPRPSVPEDRAERVREAVRSRWHGALRARRRRVVTTWAGLAAAASLAAVVLIPGVKSRLAAIFEVEPAGPVARVETVSGSARIAGMRGRDAENGRPLLVGDPLRAETGLETGPAGRIALRLESGPSLRVDVGSAVRVLSPTAVVLERGAIYVDSGAADLPLEIHTPAGTVHDVGTQFEVRLQRSGMRVRVREGLVNLERGGESFEASAGTELAVGPDGSVSRRRVPTFGPQWDWVLDVASPFELEGSSLSGFLDWVGRETGWEIQFEDRRAAVSAPSVVLHGSLDGLRPDRALDAVLPTCGLTHRRDSGTLYIEALLQ